MVGAPVGAQNRREQGSQRRRTGVKQRRQPVHQTGSRPHRRAVSLGGVYLTGELTPAMTRVKICSGVGIGWASFCCDAVSTTAAATGRGHIVSGSTALGGRRRPSVSSTRSRRPQRGQARTSDFARWGGAVPARAAGATHVTDVVPSNGRGCPATGFRLADFADQHRGDGSSRARAQRLALATTICPGGGSGTMRVTSLSWLYLTLQPSPSVTLEILSVTSNADRLMDADR